MRETIKEYTTTLNLISGMPYPGSATTLKDTFVVHIAIKCTEHDNTSLGYLETTLPTI